MRGAVPFADHTVFPYGQIIAWRKSDPQGYIRESVFSEHECRGCNSQPHVPRKSCTKSQRIHAAQNMCLECSPHESACPLALCYAIRKIRQCMFHIFTTIDGFDLLKTTDRVFKKTKPVIQSWSRTEGYFSNHLLTYLRLGCKRLQWKYKQAQTNNDW